MLLIIGVWSGIPGKGGATELCHWSVHPTGQPRSSIKPPIRGITLNKWFTPGKRGNTSKFTHNHGTFYQERYLVYSGYTPLCISA